jgi:hypothetical protein
MFWKALDIFRWFYSRNKLHCIAFCFWYVLDISVSWLSLKQTFFIPVHHLCLTRAMPQLKQFCASFSSWSSRFNPRLFHARFTMVKVALDQIFLPSFFRFLLLIIPPLIHIHQSLPPEVYSSPIHVAHYYIINTVFKFVTFLTWQLASCTVKKFQISNFFN